MAENERHSVNMWIEPVHSQHQNRSSVFRE